MPVTAPNQPQETIALPIPTPVPSPRRDRVVAPQPPQPTTVLPPPQPQPTSIILPWAPLPKPKRLRRVQFRYMRTTDTEGMIKHFKNHPEDLQPGAFQRQVAADAFSEAEEPETEALLRSDKLLTLGNVNPEGHDQPTRMGIVPARYTTRHVMDAYQGLANHIHEWSNGEAGRDDIAPEIYWEDVSGEPNAEDNNQPHPEGTLRLVQEGMDEPYFLHHSELGPHLADYVDGFVNNDDYGWNTPPSQNQGHGEPENFDTNEATYQHYLNRLRKASVLEPIPKSYRQGVQ